MKDMIKFLSITTAKSLRIFLYIIIGIMFYEGNIHGTLNLFTIDRMISIFMILFVNVLTSWLEMDK